MFVCPFVFGDLEKLYIRQLFPIPNIAETRPLLLNSNPKRMKSILKLREEWPATPI